MINHEDVEKMIEKYKMDNLESLAFKVCLIWIEKSRKIFPNYNHINLRKGDPRKSLIFKVCYKLVRETQGLLDEFNHGLYVQSQLDILRHINMGKGHPLVDVNCLVGDKAWKRWKLWKKKYDTVSQIKTKMPEVKIYNAKIYEAIKKTREFIDKSIGLCPTIEQYKAYESSKQLYRWINFGKISPYYLVLSPYIEKIINKDDLKKLNFDLNIYKQGIDNDVVEFFKKQFEYEFK